MNREDDRQAAAGERHGGPEGPHHAAAEPTISVVIATIGRPSLRATLESIRSQRLIEGDEILVAVDGAFPRAVEMAREAGPPVRWVQTSRRGYWGHGIRNWVFDHQGLDEPTRLHGDLLAAIDDDNVFTPWAFDSVRRAARAKPGCPLLFRVVMMDGTIIWRSAEVAANNVDTCSLVVPAKPGRFGRFGLYFGGDLHYVRSTVEAFGGSVSFEPDFICVSRPTPGVDTSQYKEDGHDG
jgi:hypothetical protein